MSFKDKIIQFPLPLGIFLLVIQLYLPNYLMVTIAYFFIGALMHVLNLKYIFLKTFIIQIFLTTLLFYANSLPNIQFLENTLNSLQMPQYILPLAFILFNTLNASIIVNLGATSVSLIKN
jgi:hypothetical protein